MDALQALITRRSIRAFTPDPVTREQVEQIIHASVFACSAGDQEPWRFVVIDDPALLAAVAQRHPHAGMVKQASVAVLLAADTSKLPFPDFWPQDLAAITQYLLVAAHAVGLGGVWLGLYPEKDRMSLLSELVHLPESVVPFALVPLGVPAQHPAQPERDHREWVRSNRWTEPFFKAAIDRLHPAE